VDPAAYVNVQVEADTAKATTQLKAFDRQVKRTARDADDASDSIRGFGREADRVRRPVDRLSGRLVNVNSQFALLRNFGRALKIPAILALGGPAVDGVNALAAGVTGLTGSLLPLAGAAASAGNAVGVFGQVAGVMAVAGVDDLTRRLAA